MPEISSTDAGKIIGLTSQSIRAHIKNGRLKARFVGPRRIVKIDVEDLRKLAEKYNYCFNEEVTAELIR